MAFAAHIDYDEDELEPTAGAEPGSPHRMQRVWQLVEYIGQHPGKSRKEIATLYAVSERQMQADLNLIRRQLGLPLVRRSGYRFDNERLAAPELTLADIELLLMLIGRGTDVPPDRLQRLVRALPTAVPPYLRPLLRVGLDNDGHQSTMFATLAHALVSRTWLALHYRDNVGGTPPIVRPETIFPYNEHWHMIAFDRKRNRLALFPLETLDAVAPAKL